MKATIKIHRLTYNLKIGVTKEERKLPQQIYLDIDFEIDIGSATKSDKVQDTLDYSEVQKEIEVHLKGKKYKLIEVLVNDIATMLITAFPEINKIVCTCWKPGAIKNATNVGVKIVKER
jgi:7,8-dihydroneopterin aldolase/epimerase/oxygenase